MSLVASLKAKLYRKYRYWKVHSVIPNRQYANFLVDHWIAPDDFTWDSGNEQLIIKDFQIPVKEKKNDFLLVPHNQVSEMRLLHKELGAQFIQRDNELFMQFDNLLLNIQTSEELLIVREVFLEGIYQFVPQRDFIVLDIGMNVGLSSLYFASHKQCKQVYGFEPFTPTYNQALNNIGNNTAIKSKIVPLNYGLADNNDAFEVEYSPANKGSMSVVYQSEYTKNDQDVRKEKIKVRDVKEVWDEINPAKENVQVVAKIDCEGAEYAIIDRMFETGILSRIDIIMMEWHLKGTDPLIEKLAKAGFESFSLKPFDKYQGKYGFIYAVRNK